MVQKTVLTDTPENLIRKYVVLLKNKGIPVDKVILFGSYAKGNPKPWSDVDICVVSKSFGKDSYDEMVMLQKLTINIDSMIEPHPYHPKDLNNPYDPLAYEIRRTGRVVQ